MDSTEHVEASEGWASNWRVIQHDSEWVQTSSHHRLVSDPEIRDVLISMGSFLRVLPGWLLTDSESSQGTREEEVHLAGLLL